MVLNTSLVSLAQSGVTEVEAEAGPQSVLVEVLGGFYFDSCLSSLEGEVDARPAPLLGHTSQINQREECS